MENPEFPDECQSTPTPTRRACSTLTTRIRRTVSAVAYYTLRECFAVIGGACSAVICFILGSPSKVIDLIWSAWEIVAPVIFMVGVNWERAFILSCIAVSLDPLFFYIPIVDETNKCLAMDNNLRTIALVLRSFTDFLLITHIIAQIWHVVETDYPKYLSEDSEPNPDSDQEFESDPEALCPLNKFVKDRLPWLTVSVIIKFLAILPIPQVAILVGFFRMRGSDFFVVRKFLNVSLVLQYLPRVYQIYLTKNEFRMAGKWVRPSFNLFLYILASHILGALWYFFAIERETSCWYKACKKTPGCVASTYSCGGSGSAKDITLLNQLCPIVKSPNSTQFDFGIFVDVLQSGNTESDHFATKLFYSLWWGLKNLSNFGTNLDTSSYLWENCFAILICVIGLLLFLYLIGNVQLYIQSATQKSLDKEKSRTERIQEKKAYITNWMKDKFLQDMRIRIKRDIKEDKVVEKNLSHDVDVTYFLKPRPSITSRVRKPILEHLGVAALKEVPFLQNLDDTKLKSLCQSMEPEVYNPNSNVVRPEAQLDRMLFIIGGEIERPDSKNFMTKGKYFGKEILEWALFNYTMRSYYDPLPRSTGLVKSCGEKVEALALKSQDLLRFLEKNVDINHPELKLSHEKGQPLPAAVQWECPEPEWRKLNCCSIWDPNSKQAAFSSVLRKEGGAFIAASSVGGQSCMDRFQAEALSINGAMQYCLGVFSGRIVVESEDEHLIACLKGGPSHSEDRVRNNLRPTLRDIGIAASKFKECNFVHCKRQTNAAARLVAIHAVGAPVSKIWKTASDISGLVAALKKDSPNLQETSQQEQNHKPGLKVPSAAAAVAHNPKDTTIAKQ